MKIPLRQHSGSGGRLGRKLALALMLLALIATASFMLLRNSSLVGVEDVEVSGLSGFYDRDAKAAVLAEARQMTTLNFDSERIAEAAAEFVDVADVKVETSFPHGAKIHMSVRRPVMIARTGGQDVVIAQTGEVMAPERAENWLPKVKIDGALGGTRVSGGRGLQAAKLLGAAPDVLLHKVQRLRWGSSGIVVTLSKGPELLFGTADSARQKWRDAAAVLASGKADGATYLDLRVAGRVAVGGIGGAPPPLTAGGSEQGASAPVPEASPQPAATPQQAAPPPQPAAPPAAAPPAASAPAAGGAAPAL